MILEQGNKEHLRSGQVKFLVLGVYQIQHLRPGQARKFTLRFDVEHVTYGQNDDFNFATVCTMIITY